MIEWIFGFACGSFMIWFLWILKEIKEGYVEYEKEKEKENA